MIAVKGIFSLLPKIDVFFIETLFIAHETYQEFCHGSTPDLLFPRILTLVNGDWPVISKRWVNDLSQMTVTLCDGYGTRGRFLWTLYTS